MKVVKKLIIGIVLVCFSFASGFIGYLIINEKNAFVISQINRNGKTEIWTDNTEKNVCDIKFQTFDGTDLKEVTSEKSEYNMEIDSTVQNGELGIRIYNNNKVLFDSNGSVNKTISISKNEGKNIKIELKGKKAKGHIKITLI